MSKTTFRIVVLLAVSQVFFPGFTKTILLLALALIGDALGALQGAIDLLIQAIQ